MFSNGTISSVHHCRRRRQYLLMFIMTPVQGRGEDSGETTGELGNFVNFSLLFFFFFVSYISLLHHCLRA